MTTWSELVAAAAEAQERFGDDELERYAAEIRADEARQLDEIAALYRDEPLEGGGA